RRSPSGMARGARNRRIYGSFVGLLLAFADVSPEAHAKVDFARLRTWGQETYNEIDRTLRVPGTRLFAETNSVYGTQYGGFNDRAYLLHNSVPVRVFNSLSH